MNTSMPPPSYEIHPDRARDAQITMPEPEVFNVVNMPQPDPDFLPLSPVSPAQKFHSHTPSSSSYYFPSRSQFGSAYPSSVSFQEPQAVVSYQNGGGDSDAPPLDGVVATRPSPLGSHSEQSSTRGIADISILSGGSKTNGKCCCIVM